MSDPGGRAEPSASVGDADDRGSLTVASRAVETIAGREAARAARGLGADPAATPSVSARVAGRRTTFDLGVTLPWGRPVLETATQVHREVRDRTAALSGLVVDDVRLTVDRLASSARSEADSERNPEATAPTRPAPAPRGAGPAVAWGLLLSVAVVALGAVAAHDALSATGVITEGAWSTAAARSVDGLTPQWWVVVVGVAAVLLGLLLVVAALRPRPRRALAFTEPAAVSLLVRDLPRAASGLARGVDGVLAARSDTTRRRLRIWVDTTGDPGVASAVQERVTAQLAVLARPPRVVVIDSAATRSAS